MLAERARQVRPFMQRPINEEVDVFGGTCFGTRGNRHAANQCKRNMKLIEGCRDSSESFVVHPFL